MSVRPDDPRFRSHSVFSDLERYINLYEHLSFSVFGFVTMGTRAACNVDAYVYGAMCGTMRSIRAVLVDGRVNDAYALLRKQFDCAVINIYSGLYLREHFSIEQLIVEQIQGWVDGTSQLPPYKAMWSYIQSSQEVAPITERIQSDDRLKHVRDRCNDHLHYNFYRNVLLNDDVSVRDRLNILSEFAMDLRDVMTFHVAYTFFANDHYMMSSDYVDSLDCGMTPETDSQYWVATPVQDVFDAIVTKHRPDVAATIRANTSMQLS